MPNHQPMTTTAVTDEMIPAIIDLISAQETRQFARDPHLHAVRSRARIEAALASQRAGKIAPIVALDSDGHMRGYVHPSVWELGANSMLHAFLTPRNGIAETLTLPDPAHEDAIPVAEALLKELSVIWRNHNTTGDLIRWPHSDPWLEPLLLDQGFLLDSICALRLPQPLAPQMDSAALSIRPAQPADEEALAALFREELEYHEHFVPGARTSPIALEAFHAKLTHLWSGASLQDGAPLVLVVESANKVVAMAENTLLDVSSQDEPGFTPPGRYGCIDNMSVHAEFRGRGVGRQLVQAVFDAFATMQLDGYVLWYNPDNPKAERFWPYLGFQPLWTTYQRSYNGSSQIVEK